MGREIVPYVKMFELLVQLEHIRPLTPSEQKLLQSICATLEFATRSEEIIQKMEFDKLNAYYLETLDDTEFTEPSA